MRILYDQGENPFWEKNPREVSDQGENPFWAKPPWKWLGVWVWTADV